MDAKNIAAAQGMVTGVAIHTDDDRSGPTVRSSSRPLLRDGSLRSFHYSINRGHLLSSDGRRESNGDTHCQA